VSELYHQSLCVCLNSMIRAIKQGGNKEDLSTAEFYSSFKCFLLIILFIRSLISIVKLKPNIKSSFKMRDTMIHSST
jgi:hypothetical protein